jgi:hypothetical protein
MTIAGGSFDRLAAIAATAMVVRTKMRRRCVCISRARENISGGILAQTLRSNDL